MYQSFYYNVKEYWDNFLLFHNIERVYVVTSYLIYIGWLGMNHYIHKSKYNCAKRFVVDGFLH